MLCFCGNNIIDICTSFNSSLICYPVTIIDTSNSFSNYYNYRDTTCHLTSNVGRLLAGFVWYEMLTGNDVRNNPYKNKKLTDEQNANLKEAAHYACTNYATYDPALVTAK